MSLHYESAEGQIVQAREYSDPSNPYSAATALALALGQVHATLALVDAHIDTGSALADVVEVLAGLRAEVTALRSEVTDVARAIRAGVAS